MWNLTAFYRNEDGQICELCNKMEIFNVFEVTHTDGRVFETGSHCIEYLLAQNISTENLAHLKTRVINTSSFYKSLMSPFKKTSANGNAKKKIKGQNFTVFKKPAGFICVSDNKFSKCCDNVVSAKLDWFQQYFQLYRH